MNTKYDQKDKSIYSKHVLRVLVVFLFFIGNANAQKILVKGVVTSGEDGEPIPGLSVVVKGTSKGTVTDFDGNYKIKATKGAQLEFSYIGMDNQVLKVTGKQLNVVMTSSMENLEQVVVIGYGTQKKKEVTGAVSRIDAKDIEVTVTSDLSTALQGQVAGVAVTPSTEPGEPASILIRGLSSAEGNNTPLYVVDGIPQYGDPQLSPAEIESIDILKDAASASIYGSRGAAGVILITTKQAKEGALKVTVNATKGFRKITSGLPYMNAAETLYFNSQYTSSNFQHPGNSPLLNNTDMVDAIEHDIADSQTYTVNISGGTKKQSYSINAGVFDQELNIINSDFKRYSVRANAKLEKGNFTFTPGISVQYENGASAPNTIYRQALSYSALAPRIEPGQLEVTTTSTNGAVFKDIYGALKGLNGVNKKKRTRSSYNMRSQLKINKDLSLVSNLGFTQDISTQDQYAQRVNVWKPNKVTGILERANNNGSDGVKQFTLIKKSKLLIDGGLNFNKKIGDHKIQALALFSVEEDRAEGLRVNRSEFNLTTDGRTPLFSEGLGIPTVSDGQAISATNNYLVRTLGVVGRVLYNYKGKYLLNISMRRDGSSKFSEGNKWSTFPSVSVGWNVADEEFWKPIKSVVNQFRIRASQGTTGSDRIRPDSSYSLITYGADYATSTGERVQGGTLRTHANPNSQWETTKQLNIGHDVSFFKNKVTLAADYYITTKTNMLFPIQTPPSIGGGSVTGRSQLNFNVGDMENRGVEYSIGYRGKYKDFQWSVNGSYSKNRNKVLKIHQGLSEITSSTGVSGNSGRYSTIAIGREAGAFFLHKTDGVINDAQELEAYKKEVTSVHGFIPQLGDLKFIDRDGNNIVDDRDREYAGSALPDYEVGFRTNFTFKNFDLSTQWQAVMGTEIINEAKRNAYNEQRHKDLVYMWTPINAASNIPKFYDDRGRHPNLFSNTDYWLEDGSFIRLNNITFGYSLPKKLVETLGLSKLRMFVTAQNAITFTEYSGYSPQVSGNVTRKGVDDGRKPVSSLYTAGININF